jgi:hypothetical protein
MDLCQNKHRRLIVIVLGVTFTTLLLTNCRRLVFRHGWNRQWGPLVPHSSFPGDCGICHIPDRWDKLRDDFSFDHAQETGYALEGSHAGAACLRCHNDRGPVAVYLARGCGGCHPDPHASAMGLACGRCHDQDSWEPTGLIAEHARTRFPLIASHAITPCESCHPGASAGQFRGASIQCELCHRDDLARVTSPDHAANNWTDCQQCHIPVGWAGATVQHDFFALTGGHDGLDCSQCHTGGTFAGLSSDCYSCHSANYQSAPDHVAQNYSQSCEDCHSTTAWTPATFDHSGFPLTGGHDGLDCSQCHTGGTYTGLSTDCYDCHDSDYQDAQDHASLSFPHDCAECHSTSAWTPANFQHTFPLTGDHDLSCTACHTTGTTNTFSCLNCHAHQKGDMDDEHEDENGYSYSSAACYQCHPDGKE